jgi:hypothetical protein
MKSLGQRADGLRLERMQASPRWAGEGFRNLHPITAGPARPGRAAPDACATSCAAARAACPPHRCRRPTRGRPGQRPADSGLRATWLGHSTVLIEIDGLRC